MSEARYAEAARRWIRSALPEAPPRLPGDRRQLVGAVGGALRSRRRKRIVLRSVGSLAAAAAAVVLATHLDLRPRGPHVAQAPVASNPAADARALTVVGTNGSRGSGLALDVDAVRPVRRGMRLPPGIQLVAPESGDVQIGTPQGTLLTLESGGTLTVTESTETQRFALLRGAVRARVAKLAPGERFLINSADAEIEVHGTQFRVALVEEDPTCPGQPMTRVSVTEGVVSVRAGGQEIRLHPGEQWPKGCAAGARAPQATRLWRPPHVASSKPWASVFRVAPPAPAEAPVPPPEAPAPSPLAATPVAVPPVQSPAAPAPSVVPQPPVAPSQLQAQNDLFAAAMRAKKVGREMDAIRYLSRLLRLYPQGQLAESALVQRMRLLAAGDAAAGAEAATEYLARYPDGAARSEAEQFLARSVANRP